MVDPDAIPVDDLKRRVRDGKELDLLRSSPGYKQFLDLLSSLRGSVYLDILSSTDPSDTLSKVGEARAIQRVLTLVDDECAEAAEVARQLDGSLDAVRSREATRSRPRFPASLGRPADTADLHF